MCLPLSMFIVKMSIHAWNQQKIEKTFKKPQQPVGDHKKDEPNRTQYFIFIHIPYFSLLLFCGAALANTHIYIDRERERHCKWDLWHGKIIFLPCIKMLCRELYVYIYFISKRTEYTAEFSKLCNHLLLLLLHMMMIISMSESPCCFYPNILP